MAEPHLRGTVAFIRCNRSGRCSPAPVFGSALKSPLIRWLPIAPVQCISSRGSGRGSERGPPLEEKTSAAYGVAGSLGGKRVRRRLQLMPFSVVSPPSGGLRQEKGHEWHVPPERSARNPCRNRLEFPFPVSASGIGIASVNSVREQVQRRRSASSPQSAAVRRPRMS